MWCMVCLYCQSAGVDGGKAYFHGDGDHGLIAMMDSTGAYGFFQYDPVG